MLDGLDSVDWSKLTHAYGSAADVPGLLRSLRDAPPDPTGEGPLWKLFGNIWHQSTVYEATVPAVPFLIELAVDPGTSDRPGILLLVASIADGDGGKWTPAANQAVAAGAGALLPLTGDPNVDVRLGAAHVLARLPSMAAEIGPLLRQMVDTETAGLHRAGVLLLLGLAGHAADATLDLLARTFRDPAEQMAADLSLGRLSPGRLSTSAVGRLVDAADHGGRDVEALFRGLPWDVGDGGVEEVVESLGPDVSASRIERLLARVEAGTADREAVGLLLGLAFPPRHRPLTAGDLSVSQRRLLGAVVAAGVAPLTLRLNGLPHSLAGLGHLATGREW